MVTTVADLMTRNPETLDKEQCLPVARELMHWRRVRHLPVVDRTRLVGLVTHRDLLAAQHSALNEFYQTDRDLDEHTDEQLTIPVAWIMQKEVRTADPSESAADVAKRMLENGDGCAPVVENGELVGIVTEADFMKYAMQSLDWKPPSLPQPGSSSSSPVHVLELRKRKAVSSVRTRGVPLEGEKDALLGDNNVAVKKMRRRWLGIGLVFGGLVLTAVLALRFQRAQRALEPIEAASKRHDVLWESTVASSADPKAPSPLLEPSLGQVTGDTPTGRRRAARPQVSTKRLRKQSVAIPRSPTVPAIPSRSPVTNATKGTSAPPKSGDTSPQSEKAGTAAEPLTPDAVIMGPVSEEEFPLPETYRVPAAPPRSDGDKKSRPGRRRPWVPETIPKVW